MDSAVLKNNPFICPFVLSVLFKIKPFMDFYSFFLSECRLKPLLNIFMLFSPHVTLLKSSVCLVNT